MEIAPDIILTVLVSLGVTLVTLFIAIGRYREKIDSLEKSNEKQDVKIEKLRTDVDKLLEFKTNTQKFIDSKIYKSKSPLNLTDFGWKLVKESGFQTIFDEHKGDLVKKLYEKKPKTKYDVQEEARELMGELVEYKAFQPIKTYAFETGKDYEQILRAGALLLRDYYFEVHTEIDS